MTKHEHVKITKSHTEDPASVVIKKPIKAEDGSSPYGDETTFKSKDGYLIHATYVNDTTLHGVSIRKGNSPMVFVEAVDVKSVK